MIIQAANTLAQARRAGKLAGHATVQPDWPVVARRIREEATDGWDDFTVDLDGAGPVHGQGLLGCHRAAR